MKAKPFMLPPSGFFTKSTPNFSKRSHAAYTSGTDSPMCPAQSFHLTQSMHSTTMIGFHLPRHSFMNGATEQTYRSPWAPHSRCVP